MRSNSRTSLVTILFIAIGACSAAPDRVQPAPEQGLEYFKLEQCRRANIPNNFVEVDWLPHNAGEVMRQSTPWSLHLERFGDEIVIRDRISNCNIRLTTGPNPILEAMNTPTREPIGAHGNPRINGLLEHQRALAIEYERCISNTTSYFIGLIDAGHLSNEQALGFIERAGSHAVPCYGITGALEFATIVKSDSIRIAVFGYPGQLIVGNLQ